MVSLVLTAVHVQDLRAYAFNTVYLSLAVSVGQIEDFHYV